MMKMIWWTHCGNMTRNNVSQTDDDDSEFHPQQVSSSIMRRTEELSRGCRIALCEFLHVCEDVDQFSSAEGADELLDDVRSLGMGKGMGKWKQKGRRGRKNKTQSHDETSEEEWWMWSFGFRSKDRKGTKDTTFLVMGESHFRSFFCLFLFLDLRFPAAASISLSLFFPQKSFIHSLDLFLVLGKKWKPSSAMEVSSSHPHPSTDSFHPKSFPPPHGLKRLLPHSSDRTSSHRQRKKNQRKRNRRERRRRKGLTGVGGRASAAAPMMLAFFAAAPLRSPASGTATPLSRAFMIALSASG